MRGADVGEDRHPRATRARLEVELRQIFCQLEADGRLSPESHPRVLGLVDRFGAFWERVASALAPGGRVFFADDAYRTPDELIEGAESSTIRRRLRDGTEFRAVKVPHRAARSLISKRRTA